MAERFAEARCFSLRLAIRNLDADVVFFSLAHNWRSKRTCAGIYRL